MANADRTKSEVVEELTGKFRDSNGAVLTEYRGLTVAELKELRTSLQGNAQFRVVKNTLTKRAAKDAGLDDAIAPLLTGPSAIAFINGDVAQAAKGLQEFSKANPLLVIKGGVLDGKLLDAKQVGQLASLEPREVLLAKVAGGIKAGMAKAAGTFAALPTQTAQLAEALRVKREAAGETAEAPAEAAPAEAAADAPAAE
jgi:large subunit ribosomal protein L10